jgi:1-pyrroline-5-carboxylate dehydrogenase
MHRNWRKTDFVEKITMQAAKRKLDDLSIVPILSWNNERIKAHIDAVLELDGAELLFGGVPLKNHTIPSMYGSYEPTAIKVPLKHFRGKKKRELLTTELFGPFQIVVEYGNNDIETVLDILNGVPHFLTAACVSNDMLFNERILSHTMNGT